MQGAGTPKAMDRRTVFLSALALGIGVVAAVLAQLLQMLIGLITHLSFYGDVGWSLVSPAHHDLGLWVIAIPVIGALIIGFMARYGSPAIRGHGIPEAMEQVLVNRSRISLKVLFLKPLSAAISIGTGGPFGAEGPIIATGGALGSVVGQYVRVTADERKALLAAGAAAGMTATFGTPLAAVLLAIELLLFEFRARSFVPVLIACLAAAIMRGAWVGFAPFFPMPALAWPTPAAMLACVPLGLAIGVAAVAITRALYAVEDGFAKLPLHWMWWPALGAVAVGVIGYAVPRTLGVGYDNITESLSGQLAGQALWILGAAKLVSWIISLGSGTSGGTLAPLMTVGACLGAVLGQLAEGLFPGLGLRPELAALVGMAAIFAGSARTLFMAVIFALETTWQLPALLPLLIGCGMAYLLSSLTMHQTIMTEKILRRGVRVPSDYHSDFFLQEPVGNHAQRPAVTLQADLTLGEAKSWLESGKPGSLHQGYPLVDGEGRLLGVLTRKDIYLSGHEHQTPLRQLVGRQVLVIAEDADLRHAIKIMAAANVGRLPVVEAGAQARLCGMLTRSDILGAYRRRLEDQYHSGDSGK
ncbi:MAG: chloride channel protein [Betaproteobacteria bacterium]|nr:chloride channel protein [Betaproteobacteria bacterium]MDE2622658.1 chloride channel protein [Betaproteobacteria bacterium]